MKLNKAVHPPAAASVRERERETERATVVNTLGRIVWVADLFVAAPRYGLKGRAQRSLGHGNSLRRIERI